VLPSLGHFFSGGKWKRHAKALAGILFASSLAVGLIAGYWVAAGEALAAFPNALGIHDIGLVGQALLYGTAIIVTVELANFLISACQVGLASWAVRGAVEEAQRPGVDHLRVVEISVDNTSQVAARSPSPSLTYSQKDIAPAPGSPTSGNAQRKLDPFSPSPIEESPLPRVDEEEGQRNGGGIVRRGSNVTPEPYETTPHSLIPIPVLVA
jgi:hypothetical protein